MRAAFFDMDFTLLRIDSAILWMRFLRARGELSRLELARAVYWSALYKLALLDMDVLADRLVSKMRGTVEAELMLKAHEFYQTQVAHQVAPAALKAIETHRQRGDRIVLLTATTQFLAHNVSRALQLDHTLCTELEVQSGLLTGSISTRCFGRHKVHVAELFAAQHGIELAQSSFYSDSFNDLPMLLRVGEPIAINPDARLRRYARKRNWRIEHWAQL